MNRRTFLSNTSLTGISMLGLPLLPVFKDFKMMEFNDIPTDLIVLFQGDSVTDNGRNRSDYYANHAGGLGLGYPFNAASVLLGQHPTKNLRFYNRGVSGHKVFELANRWEEDALMLQPDVLSILIGVNDFWHVLDFDYKGTVKTYKDDYRKLLERTKKRLPKVKLIIGEPFALIGGTAIDEAEWIPQFAAYQQVAKDIATEFDAAFIPYQSIFDKALKEAPVSYWCPDGVHPSIAGHYLMAVSWLETFMKVVSKH